MIEEIEEDQEDTKPKKKKSNTKIADFCNKWIKKIDSIDSDYKRNREEAYRYYKAETLSDKDKSDDTKKKRRRSSFVQPVVADHVHAALPIFMKTFAGDEEVTTLKPVEKSDVRGTPYMHELVNYQFKVKNTWYLTLMDFLLDALILKIGIFKYQWFKKTTIIEKEYSGLSQIELEIKLQAQNASLYELKPIIDDKNPIPIFDAVIQYKIEDEYPLVEAVPPCQFGFIDNGNIDNSPFVYHKFTISKYEFIKAYGNKLFNKVKDTKSDNSNVNSILEEEREEEATSTSSVDEDSEDCEFTGYECYFKDTEDGTPMIAIICNEILLKIQKNKYGRPPFRLFTPLKISHRIKGISFYDLHKLYQKLMSVLIRQQLENIYHTNNKRILYDPLLVAPDAIQNNNFPGGLIPGKLGGMQEFETRDLGQGAFGMIEYVNKTIEYHGGIPRSYQGVDIKQLNKTYRGQSQQIYQASQRIEMMNRLLAEMTISPLVGDFVSMNIKFLKKKTSLRILNEWIEFEPDNIIGNYDIIVNTGVGTNNKDLVIMQLQQILGIYNQVYKTGIPVVSPQNVQHTIKELVKTMGFKNTDDFVSDPKMIESVMNLLKVAGKHTMQMGMNDPELINAIQAVAANMGMMGNMQKKNQQQEKTSVEQPAVINQPGVPEQERQPTLTSDGGGHFG